LDARFARFLIDSPARELERYVPTMLWCDGGDLSKGGLIASCHVTLRDGDHPVRHKGLGRFFVEGSTAGIQSKHAVRLRLILGRLSAAVEPRDMALPGLALYPLKGARRGTWAVSVSGNWRVTFRFEGPDATDVDYEDYH
jgi:toxin HigB-1